MSDVQSPITIYPGKGSGFKSVPSWRFVRWLPKFENHGELLVEANDLLYVDGWVATVLRTLCEYRARRMQTSVVIAPPSEPSIDALLRDALGTDLPSAVSWGPREGEEELGHARQIGGAGSEMERHPDRIILPAHRIYARATRRDICRLLPRSLDLADRGRERAFVCQAFSELTDNALLYGTTSPVGAVASIVANPARRRLDLVVCDLGQGVPSASMNDFIYNLGHSRPSKQTAITGLIASARKRELAATFHFITNGNYIRCAVLEDGGNHILGRWNVGHVGLLPGFTAGIEILW